MADITTNDTTVDSYIVDRLANYNTTAEGSVLPPPQKGETRVPYVSNLQVVNVSALVGATAFTLAWANVDFDPTLKVDHYNIYYTENGNSSQPVGPFTAKQSPAQISIQAETEIPITFYVQTALASGMVSNLLTSPTTAALTLPFSLDITVPPGSITQTELASYLRPPVVVMSLPSLPDSTYPQGSTVFLTTDNKLYRSTGTTWTVYVDGADLTAGSVTQAQLLASLRPPVVVAVLPTLPSVNFPQGSTVFLTTDNKLYRSTGAAWTNAVDGQDIVAGSVLMAAFAAGIRPPVIVTSLPGTFGAYPQGATVVLTTDNKLYRSTGASWVKTVDGADVVANSIIAGSFAAGAVAANDIAAAAIDATKINIKQIIVVGLTLTDNSPSAGNVAWSACTVYYNGSAYSIASGNTSGGNKFISWTIGAGTFTQGAVFTSGPTAFLIATNNAGTSDVAWNKLANSSIQRNNLSFGLLTGCSIQPVSTTSGIDTNIGVSGAPIPTNLINIGSGGGALLTVGIRTNHTRIVNGDRKLEMRFQADGQTAQSYTIFDVNDITWNQSAKTIAQVISGDGSVAGDIINFYIGIGFNTSLIVDAVTSVLPSGIGTGAGLFDISLLYATQNP